MLGALISCAVALLFPLFASYRALTSNDVSLIRPWLMYWVVLATCLSAESVMYPLLQYLPFYGLLRLAFLMWLVLPQTQGAIQLYVTKFEPWLSTHDQKIDGAILRTVTWVNDSPLSLLLSFAGIELPKLQSGSENAANLTPQSYTITDMLMSRFRLPLSAETNLSAYLPAFLSGQEPTNPEEASQLRSRITGLLQTLDASSFVSAAPAREPSRFSDDYDIVDAPSAPTQPVHTTETEIEREIEASIKASGSQQESAQARKRWW